jgi:uridine kinase
MRLSRYPYYREAAKCLKPILENLPGKIIAIHGPMGSGKTSLGRYLACRFNVSLIETDLFLNSRSGGLDYRIEEIGKIISHRIDRCDPLPVIIESVIVLDILKQLNRNNDFLIYIYSDDSKNDQRSLIKYFKEDKLTKEIIEYERNFSPEYTSSIVLKRPRLA